MRFRHLRPASPLVAGSKSNTFTSPDVKFRKPSRISTVVVLPAPFGPRSANISPFATVKSIPATANLSPYFFTSPFIWIAICGAIFEDALVFMATSCRNSDELGN